MTTTSEQVRDTRGRTRRPGSDRPTLRFFYSPTARPSRRAEALLVQVLQRPQNRRAFSLQRIDCDKHPQLVERYAVKQLPTLIVIESGRVLGRLEGSFGCGEIEKLLEQRLNGEAERRPVENRTGWSLHAVAAVSSKANESLEDGLAHPARDGRTQSPYTPVGLRLPASLSFEGWQALGRRIGSITNASSWWLGDWAFYGEGRYGEKYKQAIAVTGLDYQTLRNYAWVAGRFDVSRRRDKLSFGHHAELAALSEHEQDEWLDQAERGRWSRNELRTHLRNEKRTRIPGGVERVRLNVDSARVQRWKAAAEAERLDLTDWLVAAADDAARHVVVTLAGGTRTPSSADGETALPVAVSAC
jgi:hypothetical protein